MKNEKPSAIGKTIQVIVIALVFLVIGFMGGGSYEKDQARQQAEDRIIKRIAKSVDDSIAPMRFGLQTDIKDAMALCSAASFRSIRAADTVTKDFDEQKRTIEQELKK